MSKGRINDEIDKAYYSSEREIKSKVILNYNEPYFVSNPSVAEVTPVIVNFVNTNFNKSIQPDEEMEARTEYATTEEDYFKLDGSFVLPSEDGIDYNGGLITEDVVNKIDPFKLSINFANDAIDGTMSAATIVFDDNFPSNISINIKKANGDVLYEYSTTTNSDSRILIEFNKVIDFTKDIGEAYLNITASNWKYEDNKRRIRFKKIYFGVVEEYNDTEIINLNILNQTKKFCEEVPEDECDVTLNNFEGKFDLLNNQSIKKYLNKKSRIIPFLGIRTNSGVKYEERGTYFFTELKNSDDGTATLSGKSIINLIKNETITQYDNGYFDEDTQCYEMNYLLGDGSLFEGNTSVADSDMMYGLSFFIESLLQKISGSTIHFNYYRNNIHNNKYMGDWSVLYGKSKCKTVIELLQKLAVASGCILKNEMYGNALSIVPIEAYNYEDKAKTDEEIVTDIITLEDIVTEPTVTKIDKINKVKFTETITTEMFADTYENYSQLKIEKEITRDNEIFPVFFGNETQIKPADKNSLLNDLQIAQSATYALPGKTERTSHELNVNKHVLYINSRLSKGQTYSRTINIATLSTIEKTMEYIQKDNPQTKDVALEINNEFIPLQIYKNNVLINNIDEVAKYYINNATQYEVEFEFFGNTRIETGDTIKVETRYGYIYVWVEYIEFKYDGGLTCKVKGVSTGGIIYE